MLAPEPQSPPAHQAPTLVLATAHYSKFWEDLEDLVVGGKEAVIRWAGVC